MQESENERAQAHDRERERERSRGQGSESAREQFDLLAHLAADPENQLREIAPGVYMVDRERGGWGATF